MPPPGRYTCKNLSSLPITSTCTRACADAPRKSAAPQYIRLSAAHTQGARTPRRQGLRRRAPSGPARRLAIPPLLPGVPIARTPLRVTYDLVRTAAQQCHVRRHGIVAGDEHQARARVPRAGACGQVGAQTEQAGTCWPAARARPRPNAPSSRTASARETRARGARRRPRACAGTASRRRTARRRARAPVPRPQDRAASARGALCPGSTHARCVPGGCRKSTS